MATAAMHGVTMMLSLPLSLPPSAPSSTEHERVLLLGFLLAATAAGDSDIRLLERLPGVLNLPRLGLTLDSPGRSRDSSRSPGTGNRQTRRRRQRR